MKQSKIDSFMEQSLNVASGFIIAALTWEYVVRPLIYAGYLSVESTLPITIIFTVISFARGLTWRRIFNGKQPWQMLKRKFTRST